MKLFSVLLASQAVLAHGTYWGHGHGHDFNDFGLNHCWGSDDCNYPSNNYGYHGHGGNYLHRHRGGRFPHYHSNRWNNWNWDCCDYYQTPGCIVECIPAPPLKPVPIPAVPEAAAAAAAAASTAS